MDLFAAVREPRAPTPRPPLLVLLHGLGADEQDLLPVAERLDPRLLCVSLRGPHEAPPMGYAWYSIDWRSSPPRFDAHQAEESRRLLCEMLPGLAERHGADPSRTFLFGFSQGAAMALAVATTRPDLVRGAVLHSGRVISDLPGHLAPDAALRALEVLVLHGVEDDVLPVENGREIRDLLAPHLGPRLTYSEHRAGHFVSPETLADAAGWISARI